MDRPPGARKPVRWNSSRRAASNVTSDAVGVDGVRRLYVTVPVLAAIDTGLYIGMGIDRDAAFGESDRIYRSYLWLLGLVSLMGLGAAGLGSHLFVVRPMKSLKAVADRIAAGDLSARTQLASSVVGVSELGDAVNAMADALDKRAQEREQAEGELRDSEDRYRLLFAQNPHPMWVYDADDSRLPRSQRRGGPSLRIYARRVSRHAPHRHPSAGGRGQAAGGARRAARGR